MPDVREHVRGVSDGGKLLMREEGEGGSARIHHVKTYMPRRLIQNPNPQQAGIGPELHEARSNCVGGNGTNLATFRGECAAGSLDMSAAVTSFLVSKSVEAVRRTIDHLHDNLWVDMDRQL